MYLLFRMMRVNNEYIKQHFNIEVQSVKKLHGYETLNYLVKSKCGERFILKKHTNADKATLHFLELESKTLLHLQKHLPNNFPVPIASMQGNFILKDTNGDGLRLLSFLEGNFFNEVSQTTELYASLGKFLASTDKALLNLDLFGLSAKEINWDLQHFLKNEILISHIKNPAVKKIVSYFTACYKREVLPFQYQLRKSIIHSDANEQNILVENGEVSGMIDFGDFCYAPLINELAIAITYAMQDKKTPIEWACIVIKAYHEILPLQKVEVKLLYWLVAARICTSLINSAYTASLQPKNEYVSSSEAAMVILLNKWIKINPEFATESFLNTIGLETNNLNINIEAEKNRRDTYLSKAYSLSYSRPIKMKSAAFQYMYDATGNTFLDAYNNIPLVGHAHPAITEAAQKQISLLNTNTRYIYDALHEYAENLLSKFPPQLNKVFFVNSGSAASDLAIRLATNYAQKSQIAVMEHGYHGNTSIGINISAYKAEGKGGKGLPTNVIKIPIPDTFKGKYTGVAAGENYAKDTIEFLKEKETMPAAFIAEPIIGCGGQVPLPTGFLSTLYPFLKANNIVCISDEVQVGMGRLGNVFWGFEQHHVVPDIVVAGKPIGNGHPLGAVVCTEEIAQSFENGMEFFSSFGGNPVSCVIGNTVLKVLEEEALQQNAKENGNYLLNAFKAMDKDDSLIGDVRGSGLFLGVELVDEENNRNAKAGEYAAFIKNYLRENFILSSTDGPYDSVIKFKPPLCFNRSNADLLLEQFKKGLKKLSP
mgnify:CR=1 FL=1